jgi:uncharacterized membrane protein
MKAESDASAPPVDPTFPPAAYERIARLLRIGVFSFLLLAGVGLALQLLRNPSEGVAALLSSSPTRAYSSLSLFWQQLAAGSSDALILLGIYVMIAVTVGRVVLAATDFYRGRERALAVISAVVVGLLLVALFVVAPFVH